jgi:polar amino acid transport system substrate-binding protein
MLGSHRRRPRVGVVATLLTMSFLVACSSAAGHSSSSKATTSATAPATLAKKKPTLIIASIPDYPPAAFLPPNGRALAGWNIDLGKALAKRLGRTAKFVNVAFPSLIPGLQARKYDLGMANITITSDRKKVLDFVSYIKVQSAFMLLKTSPLDPTSLDSLCGLSVAVLQGSDAGADAETQAQKCESAGKSSVDVQTYPTQDAATLAVVSGRAQLTSGGFEGLSYVAQQSKGKFKITFHYGDKQAGIAFPKRSRLAKPVLGALNKLMADGTYRKILTRWHVLPDAVRPAVLNPRTSD